MSQLETILEKTGTIIDRQLDEILKQQETGGEVQSETILHMATIVSYYERLQRNRINIHSNSHSETESGT